MRDQEAGEEGRRGESECVGGSLDSMGGILFISQSLFPILYSEMHMGGVNIAHKKGRSRYIHDTQSGSYALFLS